MRLGKKNIISCGLKIADSRMFREDKIWSCYSNDKVDIGETLTKVTRTINKASPLSRPLAALSIGSSNEPQFRILETSFRRGVYLLDIEKEALDIVQERIRRQRTDHVAAIRGDYNKIFLDTKNTRKFLKTKLAGQKMNLINLHHSLYYCQEENWQMLFDNLYKEVLARQGAIHAVLMASRVSQHYTTTWLYNYFVGKFFGGCGRQDLYKFGRGLKRYPLYRHAQILLRKHRVYFWVDDFEKFMSVVWMILLYPNVHQYSLKQRREITDFIYREFYKVKRPLLQIQDHMVIYRGIGFKGLI